MRSGGITGSLVLIALGAILYWAVAVEVEGFNIDMIGLILLAVGTIALVLTLLTTSATDDVERGTDVTIIEH